MSPPRYALVAFDLDGTLVDSVRTAGAVLNAMRHDRGVPPVETAPLAPLMSLGGPAFLRAGLAGCAADPAADLAEFRARYAAAPASPDELFPGTAAVLARIAEAGIPLAVCTNKPRRLAEKVLADTGIAPLLRALAAGDDPGLPQKPHPAQLVTVAAQLGAAPATLAFIGDSDTDLHAARGFGCDFFLALYGYGLGTEDPGACRGRFTAMAELPALLGLPSPVRRSAA